MDLEKKSAFVGTLPEMDPERRARLIAQFEKMKQCKLCDCLSPDLPAAGKHFLQKHQKNAANKLYTCPLCNEEYRSIFKHIELHHPDNCELCLEEGPIENHRYCQFLVDKATDRWLEQKILRSFC